MRLCVVRVREKRKEERSDNNQHDHICGVFALSLSVRAGTFLITRRVFASISKLTLSCRTSRHRVHVVHLLIRSLLGLADRQASKQAASAVTLLLPL